MQTAAKDSPLPKLVAVAPPDCCENRRVPVLRGELGEGVTGDQPARHGPPDERGEPRETDQHQVEQRPAKPRRVAGAPVGRDADEESGRGDGSHGVVAGQVGQRHRDTARGHQMVDVVVDHPENQPAYRPGEEEHERRLAHAIRPVEHDHRVQREQRGDDHDVAAGQPAVAARREDLHHRSGHEQRRHQRPGERARGDVRPQRRQQNCRYLHHRGQRREDESDGGQVRVAAVQHALRRLDPGQCVAEDEAVAHLQPVADRQVQHERRAECQLLTASIGQLAGTHVFAPASGASGRAARP